MSHQRIPPRNPTADHLTRTDREAKPLGQLRLGTGVPCRVVSCRSVRPYRGIGAAKTSGFSAFNDLPYQCMAIITGRCSTQLPGPSCQSKTGFFLRLGTVRPSKRRQPHGLNKIGDARAQSSRRPSARSFAAYLFRRQQLNDLLLRAPIHNSGHHQIDLASAHRQNLPCRWPTTNHQ